MANDPQTFAELLASAARWLDNDALAERIPEFIALAERRFNRILNTPEMEATATLVAAARVALPADLWEMRAVWIERDPRQPLEGVTQAALRGRYGAQATGLPQVFAVSGGNLLLGPAPDNAYPLVLTYKQTIPALSDAAPTNWLLTNHRRQGATTLADLIQVALHTTAREGEWLDMLWADVYFDTASVLYRDTKNGESRPGTLDDVAMRILERRRGYGLPGPFKDLSKSQLQALWRDGRKALGLENDHEFVFHVATRHEGLSRLGDAGASSFQIKAYGGHSSIVAADRYVRPSMDSLRSLATHISNPGGIRSREAPTSASDAEKH